MYFISALKSFYFVYTNDFKAEIIYIYIQNKMILKLKWNIYMQLQFVKFILSTHVYYCCYCFYYYNDDDLNFSIYVFKICFWNVCLCTFKNITFPCYFRKIYCNLIVIIFLRCLISFCCSKVYLLFCFLGHH